MEQTRGILITGASSGIGAALARRYLETGARVGVCGRDGARVEAVCAGRENAHPFVFDTTDRDAAAAAITEFGRAGPIGLAILNAGTHQATDAAAFDLDAYLRLVEVNYAGTLNCVAPVIEHMARRRRGTIALMGSVAGYTGLPAAGAYSASKSALMRLAETLHVELRALGVDVRLVSPGFVRTPLTDRNEFPMPFLLDVEDAAERIVKGLEGRRFEIAFPRRLVWPLRLLATLPAGLRLRILRRLLPDDRPLPSDVTPARRDS